MEVAGRVVLAVELEEIEESERSEVVEAEAFEVPVANDTFATVEFATSVEFEFDPAGMVGGVGATNIHRTSTDVYSASIPRDNILGTEPEVFLESELPTRNSPRVGTNCAMRSCDC